MSIEANKKVAMRLSDEVVGAGDYSVIPELIAEDYEYHGVAGLSAEGTAGFQQIISMMREAMPDLKSEVTHLIGEGEYVVMRFTFEGTNDGPFMGNPATGKSVNVTGTILRHIQDGKVVEDWDMFDMPLLLQQLGMA